jgi:preprotein translocase subunit SecA
VQIRTGEGKSILLGVVAVLFALLGFNVDVMSYSQYLSEKDHKSFQSII